MRRNKLKIKHLTIPIDFSNNMSFIFFYNFVFSVKSVTRTRSALVAGGGGARSVRSRGAHVTQRRPRTASESDTAALKTRSSDSRTRR